VGDEHQPGVVANVRGQLAQRVAHPVDLCLDEAGVVEVDADLVHGEVDASLLDGACDVLPVLPAPGVRRVRRGDERQQPSVPGSLGGAERVGQPGVPVAVAEVDRQVRTVGGEPVLQCRDQGPVLVVDGRAATVVVVVLGDLLQAVAWDVAAADDVLQEGHHLVRCLGAAEGDEEQRVVHVGGSGLGCQQFGAGRVPAGSTACAGVPAPRRGRRPCAG
jgi:hypothetical protein